MSKNRILWILLICAPLSLSAHDWGFLTNQNASVEGAGAPDSAILDSLEYTATVIPWLSAPLGKTGNLYFSASAIALYQNEQWFIIPELLRTELDFGIKDRGELKIGRMNYTDPLGFIANGIFDGLQYAHEFSGRHSLSFGVWYTGFQYKKSANITMTEDDLNQYYTDLDYNDFFDTYFAPRRAFAALDWEIYGIGELGSFDFALIGQYDLSGSKKLYHNLYFMAKLIMPVKNVTFELGGCAELAEASEHFYVSFAGELGIGWMLPGAVNDRLMLSARFSSGEIKDYNIAAFIPITTVPQGFVLRTKLSGLSVLGLDYTARFHESFSFTLAGAYFILSDLNTYQGMPNDRDGYFLGSEFFTRIIWSPFSDLQFIMGAGAFLPMLGNASPKSDILWRAELTMKLAFF